MTDAKLPTFYEFVNFDGFIKSPKVPFLSFPQRRESSLFRRFWTPAGVYPREGGGGSDDCGDFFQIREL
jgi:hypothetical protein